MRHFKHSGRRAFLRSASGAALMLPLLEYTHGHLWGTARAAQNGAPRRFVTVFSHGGTISNMNAASGEGGRLTERGSHAGKDWWRPANPDVAMFGPVLEPLMPFQERLLVIEGIDNRAAIQQHQYHTGGHYVANATALTSADITASVGADAKSLGPSIDHVVATRLAARQPTAIENVHLRVFPKTSEGTGYGTPYYRAANQEVNGERDPRAAFDALFDGVTADPADPAAVHETMRRKSVLQGLQESYDGFRTRVSGPDRMAIEAHLDHLAAIEHQLDNPVLCTPPERSDHGPTDAGNVVAPVMAEMIIAAIRCGLTNVANLELSDMLSPWVEHGQLRDQLSFGTEIGHALGHHARDVGPMGTFPDEKEDFLQYMLENQRWRMEIFAMVLAGLDDPLFMEGDYTILENSLVLFTSEFSNAAGHNSYNVPVILAGSAGGYFDTGRFISYDQANPGSSAYQSQQSTHNLCTSILQAMGESDDHFGNGDALTMGPLPDLT